MNHHPITGDSGCMHGIYIWDIHICMGYTYGLYICMGYAYGIFMGRICYLNTIVHKSFSSSNKYTFID